MATKRKKSKEKEKLDPSATQPEKTEAVRKGPAESYEEETFPIVGMGASAGGLEALTDFLSHTPSESGMAFIIVTHQHPGRPSLMPELLRKHTDMPVKEIVSGMKVEPNCVYVDPPGPTLAILGGKLTLMEQNQKAKLRLPIDYFFRTLAQDQKECAIGIVLSGTGSDGTLGLKEIKGAGGMVMVQEERSAQYSGMPHSAIATKLVDYVLPADKLPQQLVAYAKGVFQRSDSKKDINASEVPEIIRQIFVLLRNQTGHDFSLYKNTTIRRRIKRRMNLHHINQMKNYVRYLQTNPNELDVLFKELLIGVTSFFRDPKAFHALETNILPQLLADKSDDYVVRMWVPACSTGEEAYSLAILLRECMEKLKKHVGVQIFATDLDSTAIDIARKGVYPNGIAVDVTSQRLERFFLQEDSAYRVNKEIRNMVIFAPQNVLSDPPFTQLDLLSCRNLLIYLGTKLQQQLLPIFHYALKPEGILFLGSSESIGSASDLFEPLDKKWKIFRRRGAASGTYLLQFSATPSLGTDSQALSHVPLHAGAPTRPGRNLAQLANNMLLQRLVPTSLLVHEQGDIVHVHGRTGLYFEMSPGVQATNNIFNMAREGLQLALASAIRQAGNQNTPVLQHRVRVKTNGDTILVDIRVSRLSEPEEFRGLFVLSFENSRPLPLKNDKSKEKKSNEQTQSLVTDLRQELQHTRENHQNAIEEFQTTNEELNSTNEELQSTNEELQSANEELVTSKEEMQSLNEELQTVNAELQGKLEELSRVNDDLKNLLNSTHIATIFLDNDLNIKRYTERATKVMSLIGSDVGRPLTDLVSKLSYPRLIQDAREVLRTLIFKEVEVRATDGAWYLVRILPYRTSDNMIDGLVLTFVDVSDTKRAQQFADSIVQTIRDPLLVLNEDLRIVAANRAFCSTFSISDDEWQGERIYEIGHGTWNITELRHLLKEILTKNTVFEEFEVTHDFLGLGQKSVRLNARRLETDPATPAQILLAFRLHPVKGNAK